MFESAWRAGLTSRLNELSQNTKRLAWSVSQSLNFFGLSWLDELTSWLDYEPSQTWAVQFRASSRVKPSEPWLVPPLVSTRVRNTSWTHWIINFQIEYLDVHDTNGFEVDVDDEATMSCVTSTHNGDQETETKKHNTCHTSAVLFLQRGKKNQSQDSISLPRVGTWKVPSRGEKNVFSNECAVKATKRDKIEIVKSTFCHEIWVF